MTTTAIPFRTIKASTTRLSQSLRLFLLATGLALFGCGANADNTPVSSVGEYQAGKEYRIVASPQRFSPGSDKIEVVETFWYGCPHCFSLDPHIKRWAENAADDVEFIPMPAPLNRSWKQHAKAFYAAEALGIREAGHSRLFAALHAEKRRIISDDQLATFYSEFGPSEDEFKAAMNSFNVDSQIRRAQTLVGAWNIDGVPAVIVNGKYVTSPSIAGDMTTMFKVLEALIESERAKQ